ncbi:uncharacterized protein LOC129719534 [Wyeomyia smithii]|uniref:uncharacterized protein LOC129719534 n=1 Tax=Wyeomyia smithii TaxID=174621 RepID=UPI0024681157|nr:uncharacterized protein LOC129719534 [Wyeomyia smithii]
MDLLKPTTLFYKQTESKQEDQFNRKHGTKARNCDAKDLVWAKVHRNNTWSWEPAKRDLVRSDANQLKKRYESEKPRAPSTQQTSQIPLNILLESCGLSKSSTTEPEGPMSVNPGSAQSSQPMEVPHQTPARSPRTLTQQQSSQLHQSSRPQQQSPINGSRGSGSVNRCVNEPSSIKVQQQRASSAPEATEAAVKARPAQ